MIQSSRTSQLGTITELPANLLKTPPRFRLLRNGGPSLLSRLFRKIGGSIAYRFYW
jgi:hypothetical protein